MIIFTGASGGLGKDLCNSLSSIDKVTAIYNKNKILLNKKNRNIILKKLDLESEIQIKKFCNLIKKKNNNLTLVFNATKSIDNLLINCSLKEWEKIFSINLRSTFLFTKYLMSKMIKDKWGRIIFISSILAEKGEIGTASYSSSKSALKGLSSVISKEYGRFGVRSNIINLGYFNKGLINTFTSKKKNKIKLKIPTQSFGTSKDIYLTIKCLMETDYINGEEININGGIK